MKQNVGGFDRTVRLTLGPILVAFVVAVLPVTGWTQTCPANGVAGIDTSRNPDGCGGSER
jgi:hypothetical protein